MINVASQMRYNAPVFTYRACRAPALPTDSVLPSRFNLRNTMINRNCVAQFMWLTLLSCPGGLVVAAEPPRHDVPWLAEIQQIPPELPTPTRPLPSLLVDQNRQPISTANRWQAYRSELKQKWLEFLGPMPEGRPSSTYEVLREEKIEGCMRQFIKYYAEHDEPVEGYLIKPLASSLRDAQGRLPGIVALHQTSKTNIEEIAGVSGGEPHDLGVQLARAGFVVFCPRCYLWQTPPKYEIDVKSTVAYFQRRHPQTVGMHKMLFDAQRGVDILVALPDVNPDRIGAIGHSLGGKETLYLAAFDERIRAAVASEGGVELASSNWQDPWYLGKRILAADFQLNHDQVLALVAPRALLIVGGETGPGAVDGTRSWPYLKSAMEVYGLYTKPNRLGLINHGKGHTMPPDVRKRMIEWLTVYLSAS